MMTSVIVIAIDDLGLGVTFILMKEIYMLKIVKTQLKSNLS